MKRWFAPVVLLAACATQDAPSPPAVDGPNAPLAGEVSGTDAPTLRGAFEYFPESCADHSVFFAARHYYSDGTSADDVSCQYQFADGTLADGCGVTYSLPDPQLVVLTMRDNVTGATATYQDTVVGPASFVATVDVTSDVDSLTWHAKAMYGAADTGTVQISISPADTVIVDDPAIFTQRDGTVRVSAPGTYTVTVQAGVDFGEQGGCMTSASASVDVTCGS
jgi:hypothetical protein